MKIIYGSSTQKSIDRSQRINRREKKKRLSRPTAPAHDSLPGQPAAEPPSEPEKETSRSRGPKGIPHEISLLIPESPVSESGNPAEQTRRGGEWDEEWNERQPEPSAAPEMVSPAAAPTGLDERGGGIETELSSAVESAESAHPSPDVDADECDSAPDDAAELVRMLQSDAAVLLKMPLPSGCGPKPIIIYLGGEEESD